MNPEWSTPTRHIVGVGLVLLAVFLLYLSWTVLPFFVIAALLAFLLTPVINFLSGKCRLPRGLAVLLTYVVVIVVIIFSPLILIPPIVEGVNFFRDINYQVLVDQTVNWTEQTLLNLRQIDTRPFGLSIDFNTVVDPALALLQDTEAQIAVTLPSIDTLIGSLQSALTITYGVATNVAGRVFTTILAFIVTMLASIYMSLDGPKFVAYFLDKTPPAYRPEMTILLRRLTRIWRAYFRGQLTLMVIIGVVTWIGGLIIGLPGAFSLALLAGALELVPNLGPFLAAIPAVVVALIQGSTHLDVSHFWFALIVIGMYVLIQQVENTLIVPRILGEAVDLHPLVVMIAVLVGATSAGILGALLAAPVVASGREIVGYLYAKMLGQPPFPPAGAEEEASKPLWLERGLLLLQKAYRQLFTAKEANVQPSAGIQGDETTLPGDSA